MNTKERVQDFLLHTCRTVRCTSIFTVKHLVGGVTISRKFIAAFHARIIVVVGSGGPVAVTIAIVCTRVVLKTAAVDSIENRDALNCT